MSGAVITNHGQEPNSQVFEAVVATHSVTGGQSPSESAHIVDSKAKGKAASGTNQTFVDGLKYGAAGGVAGAFAKSCTAPLARLTILYQVQGFTSSSGTAGHPGSVAQPPKLRHAFLQVVRREGVAALWKGNLATILHRLPYSSINFYTYEHTNKFLVKQLPPNTDIARTLAAGALAGLVSCSAAYPLDLVRTRLAAQTQGHYYNGIVPTLRRIVADEGAAGLYRGLGATLLQVVPSLALNFCLYDTIRRSCMAVYNTTDRQHHKLQHQQQQQSALQLLAQQGQPAATAAAAQANSSKHKGILRSTSDPESLAHSLAVASTVDQGIQHSQMVIAHLNDDSSSSSSGSVRRAEAAAAAAVDAYSTAAGDVSSSADSSSSSSTDTSSSGSSSGSSSTMASIPNSSSSSSKAAVEIPAVVSLASGCISGFLTATATFPLDVIRRRMQVYGQQHHGEPVSYAQIYRQILQQGGVKGFYFGILPEYCKVVPGVAIAFCTYEQLKKWLQAD